RVEARVSLAPGLVLEADGEHLGDRAVGSRVRVTIDPDAVTVWAAGTGTSAGSGKPAGMARGER
ncbi:MAG: hypothetical protein ACRDXC_07140, partial [Acidimicrobiales bacterium]